MELVTDGAFRRIQKTLMPYATCYIIESGLVGTSCVRHPLPA